MPSIRNTPLSAFIFFLSLEPRVAYQNREAGDGGTKPATALASAGGTWEILGGRARERRGQKERANERGQRGERDGDRAEIGAKGEGGPGGEKTT